MAETITVNNSELLRLDEACRSLDAVKEAGEIIGFEFKTKVGYAIARATVAAVRAKAAFDVADQKLRATHGVYDGMLLSYAPDAKPTADQLEIASANAKKAEAYQAARMELLGEQCELEGIIKIALEDLYARPDEASKKVKRNPIPISVAAKLSPILKSEEG